MTPPMTMDARPLPERFDLKAESRLLKEGAARIPRAWFRPDDRVLLAQALGDHAVLVAGAALCLAFPTPAMWIPVWIVMAGRIHALGVLMHDLVHVKTLERCPWRRFLLDLVVCYPIVMNMDYYGLAHGFHHQEANRAGLDPYFVPLHRHHPLAYAVSVVVGSCLLILALVVRLVLYPVTLLDRRLRDLHVKFFSQLGASPDLENEERARLGQGIWAWALGPTLFWILALAGIQGAGVWWAFGIAYGFPLLLSSVLGQVRLACDHIYTEALGNTPVEQVAGATSVEAPWWQQVVLGAHGTSYHALHHLVPTLPNYRLAAAHEIMKASGSEVYRATIYPGYGAVIARLLRSQWRWVRERRARAAPAR